MHPPSIITLTMLSGCIPFYPSNSEDYYVLFLGMDFAFIGRMGVTGREWGLNYKVCYAIHH